MRGDASEAFAFAEFFPEPAKPAVENLSAAVYNILVALKICSPWAEHEGAGRGERAVQKGTPGSARAEAERRRALALKALDQRLNAATAGGSRGGQASQQPTSVQVQQQEGSGQDELGQTAYVPEKSDS